MPVEVNTAHRASSLIYGIARGGPEGIWLLPANVCIAVPLALVEAGVRFEFVDIDPQTLCMDVELAERRLASNSKQEVAGVVYVRTYGYAPDATRDLARLRNALRQDAVLIDDQALCIPLTDWQIGVEGGADVTIFSTGYGKMVDLGSGGYGLFSNQVGYTPPAAAAASDVFDQIMRTCKTAILDDQPLFLALEAPDNLPRWVFGENGREWPGYKAAIDVKLPEILAHKEEINAVYRDGLSGFWPHDQGFQNWRFNIRVKYPKLVLAALFEAGLFASNHYYPSSRLWGDRSSKRSMELHRSIINLFNDRHFDVKQAERAVEIIRHVAR